MRKKYHIHTFGCQMNVHDSEKIAGIFSDNDFRQADHARDADVIVLNTCSIREKAEQKFYSELGKLKKAKKHNPGLKIAVAGCIAQQTGKKIFSKFPYVDFVFGPGNIDKLEHWIGNDSTLRSALDDNPDFHIADLPVKRTGQHRAWVSIMYGCNNFCAYCVVPNTRGREKSRPSHDICREIQSLAEQGFREVTLLGQNVNSYGNDLNENCSFPELLDKLHEISGIERIRFVTSHPKDLSEGLIDAFRSLPKVCKHIHLPLQSGSDNILHLMNRRYSYKTYREKIDKLRSVVPGIAITTDIITGFPGETEEDFSKTVQALSDIRYDGIFAFKYSKRPGTKAIELDDHIDEKLKSERLSKVLQIQEMITFETNKQLEGSIVEILVEGRSEIDNDRMKGRTGTNKIVNYIGSDNDIGSLVDIKIKEAKLHSLFGARV